MSFGMFLKGFFSLFFCVFYFVFLVFGLNLAVTIPDKYSEVVAGEKFYFEVDVKYPENFGRVDLRFEYRVFNSEDELVAQAKVLRAVETQASFIDSISIPKSLPNGIYFLKVRILDYSDLEEEILTSFHVVSLQEDKLQLYFVILIVVVLFVALLVFYDLRENFRLRRSLQR